MDAQLDLARMADAAHYGRVLQVFDAFLGPWEEAAAAALPAGFGPWLRQRPRRHLLAADLRALALRPLQGHDVQRTPGGGGPGQRRHRGRSFVRSPPR